MQDDAESIAGCLACDLIAGRRPRPGGEVARATHWTVEHCVGPLGVGTLLVKPFRHCTSVGQLLEPESIELGPLLQRISACVQSLNACDQVYVCLWSHADWEPQHLHFVVQPAWNADRARHPGPGPATQLALFEAGEEPNTAEVEAFCERARLHLAGHSGE